MSEWWYLIWLNSSNIKRTTLLCIKFYTIRGQIYLKSPVMCVSPSPKSSPLSYSQKKSKSISHCKEKRFGWKVTRLITFYTFVKERFLKKFNKIMPIFCDQRFPIYWNSSDIWVCWIFILSFFFLFLLPPTVLLSSPSCTLSSFSCIFVH